MTYYFPNSTGLRTLANSTTPELQAPAILSHQRLTITDAVAYALAMTKSWGVTDTHVTFTHHFPDADSPGQDIVECTIATAVTTYHWSVWRTESGEIYGEA